MFKYITSSLLGVSLLLAPLVSQAADDSRITSITMTSQSTTTPGALATYELTVVTSDTIFSDEELSFIVNNDGGVDQTFDFTSTTFTSATIQGNGALPYTFAYAITMLGDLPAGTHTITLSGVKNGTTEGDLFQWGSNSTVIAPGGNTTLDLSAFSLGTASGEPTLVVFGQNIAVSWPADTNAVTYGLIVSEDVSTGDDEVREIGEDLSYVVTDLAAETTYYIDVVSYDSNGDRLPISYLAGSTTTEKPIAQTKYAKPTVSKSKIKSSTAKVQWTVGDAADYIDSFSVRLKKGKKTIATYNTISSEQLKKKLKNLNPDTKYTVQIRATYTTDETTKWSKAVDFRTKAE